MQLHHLGKSPVVRAMFGKAAFAVAALSGLLFFAGAPKAQAADRDDDHRRVNSERRFSDEDRGYFTREADNWREERREAFERRYREYHNDRDRDRDYNRYHRDRDRD